MTGDRHEESAQDEERLASLVRRGGARVQPPPEMREAVRAAVATEWRAVVAARAAAARRRARQRYALVAGACAATVAAWLALPVLQPPAGAAAGTLARVSGPVEQRSGGWLAGFTPAAAGGVVRANDELRSGAGGRAAIEIGGLSLRMDEQSEMELVATDRVALRKGALYVDAPPGAAAAFVVETDLGTLEHLGTQYESRLAAGDLRVSVREGRVRLTAAGRMFEGGAGEQFTVDADGSLRRARIPPSDAHWSWVAEIAPPFDLEDRRLDEFLRWVGRESGREVIYASPPAAAEAGRVILRGSTQGLTPQSALDAVLSTTRLEYQQPPGRLVISFRARENR